VKTQKLWSDSWWILLLVPACRQWTRRVVVFYICAGPLCIHPIFADPERRGWPPLHSPNLCRSWETRFASWLAERPWLRTSISSVSGKKCLSWFTESLHQWWEEARGGSPAGTSIILACISASMGISYVLRRRHINRFWLQATSS
jgi:hypothetical protein